MDILIQRESPVLMHLTPLTSKGRAWVARNVVEPGIPFYLNPSDTDGIVRRMEADGLNIEERA